MGPELAIDLYEVLIGLSKFHEYMREKYSRSVQNVSSLPHTSRCASVVGSGTGGTFLYKKPGSKPSTEISKF